jgi:FkbM family methyltransferase
MLKIPTKVKMRLAGTLLRVINAYYRLRGIDSSALICKRSGICWNLDLSQGVDFAIFLFGRHEPRSQSLLAREIKPGSFVLDLGANIGSYTLPLAKVVGDTGKVVAIEATDWAFARLQRNISLNGDIKDTVKPIQALLMQGNEPTETLTEVYASWSLLEEGHAIHGGQLRSTSQAERIKLDDLVQKLGLTRVDFIKMDVDGHECHVLQGAEATIRKFKPQLLVEFCSHVLVEHKRSLRELVDLLLAYGYTIAAGEDGKRFPLSLDAIESRLPSGGSMNAILWATPPVADSVEAYLSPTQLKKIG